MKKGRGYLLDFDRRERRKLKDFFNSVDNRKEGYISLDQLEEMLLGLGLAEGIEDVKRLVNNVNVDQEGRIEFEEFM
jgi:Ca2+-binding EF-hand superfamily protein